MGGEEVLSLLARRARHGTATDRWNRSPSSASGDAATAPIDVVTALGRYGLSDLPLDHLPASDGLQTLLKKARRKARHGRFPWLPGQPLAKTFQPLWRSMDSPLRQQDHTKGQNFGSFAHFASCWWGRAFSLLALQGDVRTETVSVERLLRRFLDLCRLAQEEGVGMAYEYDRQEWSSLATRIECKDPHVKPDVSFERVNTDTKRDVRGQLDRAKVPAKLTGGSEVAGKGKHRGQEQGPSKGHQRLPPPVPPHAQRKRR